MADACLLELDGVAKLYTDVGDVVHAVNGVNLRLDRGEIVALYGPSGSGKTTLLLLAGGLLAPDEGTVRIDGEDLGNLTTSELATIQRRRVGFIYQSPHLLTGVPAVENAAVKLLADGVGLRRARTTACVWLEHVGLPHRLGHTPERLSGGERQRVAIARALVNEPGVVLADEPTGSLDTQRGLEILQLLARLSRERGVSVLLATHDPRAAEIADRVLTLQDGRLAAEEPGATRATTISVAPERA